MGLYKAWVHQNHRGKLPPARGKMLHPPVVYVGPTTPFTQRGFAPLCPLFFFAARGFEEPPSAFFEGKRTDSDAIAGFRRYNLKEAAQ